MRQNLRFICEFRRRLSKPSPTFFANLSKKLKAIAATHLALGVAIFAIQDQLYPMVVEIGKMASVAGTFGGYIGSIIADLTSVDDGKSNY